MIEPLARALEDERPGLFVPWPSLADVVKPLPGTLVLVLGAPGVGKSIFSLSWCLKLGRPARLVSLDTDSKTQGARVVAALQDVPWSYVLAEPRRYAEWLRQQKLLVRVLDRQISPRELTELVEADTEYWGESPQLLVVDDTSKVISGERGYEAYDEAFGRMHRVARHHNCVVMALHHIRRNASDNSTGTKPVGLADGKYAGEYEAEIVLGLWRPYPNIMRVGVLKNRYGNSDPNGGLFVDLMLDAERVQLLDPSDWEQQQWRV